MSMIKMIYVSQWGGTLDLFDNDLFWVTNIDGLTNVATSIASVVIGGIDGDEINNIQAQPRDIIMDLRIKTGVNVEYAKRAITAIIKAKQKCTLQWTQNQRTLVIQGTVSAITMPRFKQGVTMQVSIHCGVPFWEDQNETESEISEAENLHYFTDIVGDMLYFPDPQGIPFGELDTSRTKTFYNSGDVAVGMIIEIVAYKTVTNPIIYDQYGNFFGIGYGSKPVTMAAGDKLVINTKKNEKSVKLNDVSQLDFIKPQSTWIQLEAGENTFSINSDDPEIDNMVFTLIYRQRYV